MAQSPPAAIEIRNLSKHFGGVVAVDSLSFVVRAGECVALLGPSGCGKTTTLRLIAGLETPDSGSILIAGRDVRHKRPYERNVGLVFQDYALFPHMTVEQNVAYGLRQHGVDRHALPKLVQQRLEQVKLAGFAKRRPHQLSGGEQQRVALARALATQPEVLLLDEPLSNLDAKLRQELGVELKALLSSVKATTIIVTHDQQEAMALSDRIIVMNRGRIEQAGAPHEIYGQPRNRFVADFTGETNWFRGRVTRRLGPDLWDFESCGGARFRIRSARGEEGTQVEVGVRPERITLERQSAAGGGANRLQGRVEFVGYRGPDIHYRITLRSGETVLAIEKNIGQPVQAQGAVIALQFDASGCIVLLDDARASDHAVTAPPLGTNSTVEWSGERSNA